MAREKFVRVGASWLPVALHMAAMVGLAGALLHGDGGAPADDRADQPDAAPDEGETASEEVVFGGPIEDDEVLLLDDEPLMLDGGLALGDAETDANEMTLLDGDLEVEVIDLEPIDDSDGAAYVMLADVCPVDADEESDVEIDLDLELVAGESELRSSETPPLPPLLTQEVPLAAVVDRAGVAAALDPYGRCLLAGLALVTGSSVPAPLALAIARAAVELGGAPALDTAAVAAAREAVEQLGALDLAYATGSGRIALRPTAAVAGAELFAALPDIVAEQLGDAVLRWWLDFALTASEAGAPTIAGEAEGIAGTLRWARARERHRGLTELVQALAPLQAGAELAGIDERTRYEWAREAAAAMSDVDGQLWAAHNLVRVELAAGDVGKARALLQEALALTARVERPAERREELHALAVLDTQEGENDAAWVQHQEALEIARQISDTAAEREELHALAVLDAQGGRVAEARAGFGAALKLARGAHDLAAERAEVHGLAVLDARDGRLDDARLGFHAALELARSLDDPRSERAELHELAALDARAGVVEEARAGFEAALALARALGDRAAESAELQSLGFRDLNMGRLSEAEGELGEALALARQVDQPLLIARALWSRAELEIRRGRRDEALAHFEEALDIYERLGDPDAHNGYIRLRMRELGHGG